MALQKNVSMYPAVGVSGQPVTTEQCVYTPFNYLSDGTAKAGSFAFAATSSTNTGGVAQKFAGLKGTGSPLGLVERVLDGYLDVDESGSLVYKEGLALKISIQGDYYIEATGTATVGSKVYVLPTTGEISFTTTSSDGKVDTGWVVKTAAASAGDMIVISNHSNN